MTVSTADDACAAVDLGGHVHAGRHARSAGRERAVRAATTITDDDIRAYSRRGNYHSDPETAQQIGLPGLVAQGVQVAGPAYAALLDAWGEDFLAHGELDVRFVGIVLAEHEIESRRRDRRTTPRRSPSRTSAPRAHAVVGSARRRARQPE